MKLKLETDGEIAILSASESIETKQIAVLKAGLKKLFQADKKAIALDLTAIPDKFFQQDPSLASELAQLPKWSQELGAQLVVICAAQGTNGFTERKAAFDHLRTPLNRLLALESGLTFEFQAAEQLMKEIEKKLQANAAEAAKLKNLKKENTNIKKRISALEELLQRQLAKRTPPAEPLPALKKKHETIRSLLLTVLEQEGAIAPKT